MHTINLSKAWLVYKFKTQSLLIITLILTGITGPLLAQAPVEKQAIPSWWFGVTTGTNLNFYEGGTRELNATTTTPRTFNDGYAPGLFLGATIEYYKPETLLGMMLQIGYDNRKVKFDQMMTACNCPSDLAANVSYLSIEPSLRLAPFKNGFHLFGGPRFAFLQEKSFVYQLGVNPNYPNQPLSPEVKGDFSEMDPFLISMQIGAGVDIPMSSQNRRTQFVVSPFVSFHPHFGQNLRTIESWNVSTIRVGAVIKFGVAKKMSETDVPDDVTVNERDVQFNVYSPTNIPAERTVRETFPIRNYVFFDLGSTNIPNRYVTLEKSQVASFKEENVELYTPQNLSGRSKRQLVVYYNILNILGDRMSKNPNASIKLVGSSEKNETDAREMAESVKTYLVDVFGINASRITTEGRTEPKIPSRQEGYKEELLLLEEGTRRVSIESNTPILLMEFQSGPSAPLKPVEITVKEEAPVDSYVTFENKNASTHFTSWFMEIRDKSGNVKAFGPYTQDTVIIPGKDILGTNAKGVYNVKMIGTTSTGEKVEKDTNVDMTLWVPNQADVASRFSVLYEFDESQSIAIYDTYLTEIVVKKIPANGKVVIHGYTDIIGDAQYNQQLSFKRANDVKNIMQSALAKEGRKDVTFEVLGIGEDQKLSPFENKYPEERFYNRTVIIDIIPQN